MTLIVSCSTDAAHLHVQYQSGASLSLQISSQFAGSDCYYTVVSAGQTKLLRVSTLGAFHLLKVPDEKCHILIVIDTKLKFFNSMSKCHEVYLWGKNVRLRLRYGNVLFL